MSKTIGEILTAHDDGESLTDSEIEFVVTTIRTWMSMGLDTLDSRYCFFVRDLRLRLEQFERYAYHRGLDV